MPVETHKPAELVASPNLFSAGLPSQGSSPTSPKEEHGAAVHPPPGCWGCFPRLGSRMGIVRRTLGKRLMHGKLAKVRRRLQEQFLEGHAPRNTGNPLSTVTRVHELGRPQEEIRSAGSTILAVVDSPTQRPLQHDSAVIWAGAAAASAAGSTAPATAAAGGTASTVAPSPAAPPTAAAPAAAKGATSAAALVPVPPPPPSQAELLAASILHVHVSSARRLPEADLTGGSNPFCTVAVGKERCQTRPVLSTTNPEWRESFQFSGQRVVENNMRVCFEVWSYEEFHPDTYLCQAELNLHKLHFPPPAPSAPKASSSSSPSASTSTAANYQSGTCVLNCTLTLYALSFQGKKEAGEFGELEVQVWLTPQHGVQVLAPGGLFGLVRGDDHVTALARHYKRLPMVSHSTAGTLYEEPCVLFIRVAVHKIVNLRQPAPGAPKQLFKMIKENADAAARSLENAKSSAQQSLDAAARSAQKGVSKARTALQHFARTAQDIAEQATKKLGIGSSVASASAASSDAMSTSGRTSLAPSWRASGVTDRGSDMDSFSGEEDGEEEEEEAEVEGTWCRQVHAGGGLVRTRGMSQLPGSSEDREQLRGQGSMTDDDDAGPQAFTGGSFMTGVWDRAEHGVAKERGAAPKKRVSKARAARERMEEEREDRDEQAGDEGAGGKGQEAGGAPKKKKKTVYVYLEVEYAAQTYQSRLVRLDRSTGKALIQQDFVFADVRPLMPRPLSISIFKTKEVDRVGNLVGHFTNDLTDMLRTCMKAEEADRAASYSLRPEKQTLRSATVAPCYGVPLLPFKLSDPFSGSLHMHVGAADADYRPSIFNIPMFLEHQQHGQAGSGPGAKASEEGTVQPSSGRREAGNKVDATALPSVASDLTSASAFAQFSLIPSVIRQLLPVSLLAQSTAAANGSSARAERASTAGEAARTESGTHAGLAPSVSAKAEQKPLAPASNTEVAAENPGSTVSGTTGAQGSVARAEGPEGGAEGQASGACPAEAGTPCPAAAPAIAGADAPALPGGSGRPPSFPELPAAAAAVSKAGQDAAHATPASLPSRLCRLVSAWLLLLLVRLRTFITFLQTHPGEPLANAPSISPPSPPAALGLLHFKLSNFQLQLPGGYHFSVIKCGPHWVRTPLRKAEDGLSDWSLALPVYEPATVFSMVHFVQKSSKSKGSDAEMFFRHQAWINQLPPNKDIVRNIKRFRGSITGITAGPGPEPSASQAAGAEGSTKRGRSRLGASPQPSAVDKKAQENGEEEGAERQPYISATLTVRLEYRSLPDLAAFYIRPLHPDPFYVLGLDNVSREQLDQQQHSIIGRWLSNQSPPLSPDVVKMVLRSIDNHSGNSVKRTSWHNSIGQTKVNWRRVKTGFETVQAVTRGLDHLKSWQNPVHSVLAYVVVLSLAFCPSLTLAALLGLLFKTFVVRSAKAGRPAPEHGLLQREEQDKDLDAPTDGALARLKRQYDQAVSVALLAQNLLDDVACVFERLNGLLDWADPAASFLTACAVGAGAVAVYFLGLPLVVAGVGLYFLRPPRFRDPMPSPPEALFARLPSALGCSDEVKVQNEE